MGFLLIGISGLAGAGKDTAADILVRNHKFEKLAFADKLKEICRDVFDFSVDQLWGPSHLRNEPDPRYVREDGHPLTPRHALQILGTEFGRHCYPNVWVDYAMRKVRDVSYWRSSAGCVIPDVRFPNEVAAIREAGGKVWRVSRGEGLVGEAGTHTSEHAIGDDDCDTMIRNDGTLEDLKLMIASLVGLAA